MQAGIRGEGANETKENTQTDRSVGSVRFDVDCEILQCRRMAGLCSDRCTRHLHSSIDSVGPLSSSTKASTIERGEIRDQPFGALALQQRPTLLLPNALLCTQQQANVLGVRFVGRLRAADGDDRERSSAFARCAWGAGQMATAVEQIEQHRPRAILRQ